MTGFTYHIVLGDGHESVMEVGPYPTATDALTAAGGFMGRTAKDVDVDVLCTAIYEGPTAPLAEWRVDVPEGADPQLIGFTIERYDGEDTDGSWSLNGGIRPELLVEVTS